MGDDGPTLSFGSEMEVTKLVVDGLTIAGRDTGIEGYAFGHSRRLSHFWNPSRKWLNMRTMSDGPLDFESGYFFESQKAISDRRSARGLDQGPSCSSSSIGDGASNLGGAGLVGFIFTAMF
nr:hypothetical protein [Qipengyuania citrea]